MDDVSWSTNGGGEGKGPNPEGRERKIGKKKGNFSEAGPLHASQAERNASAHGCHMSAFLKHFRARTPLAL